MSSLYKVKGFTHINFQLHENGIAWNEGLKRMQICFLGTKTPKEKVKDFLLTKQQDIY